MVGARSTVSCKKGEYIGIGERDRRLGVDGENWPKQLPKGWVKEGPVLARQIDEDTKKPPATPAPMIETMLRFPSAPIHGVQRLHEHHKAIGDSENFHTMRILRSANPEVAEEPVSRIFLMHCGLNELRKMGLYYRLASRLIKEEETTACIIRPFPGHLTRFPFQAFAETPLDNYLWDGSHLFRQFLRFMVETQWFLSAIVRRSGFRCASGANLLAEADTAEGSRLETPVLAEVMHKEWLRLYGASLATAEAEAEREQQTARPKVAPPPGELQLIEAIGALRETLNLDLYEPRGAELGAEATEASEPKLHVIGYSLGGFMAQSVFMSWPFLITSCSTLLAGGALRELAPIGFTDPEEWQTVLHSLRYELDDRMMDPDIGIDDEWVAGVDRDLFTYFKRTFYEVFQQEYRGSIQTRYEAFRDRMLFVVGGDDPVVRPESVLQNGPKGGLNLLEIGGLTHSIDEDDEDPSSRHQRSFWIPEMAALMHRFARNAGEEQDAYRPCTWFDPALESPKLSRDEWDETYYATAPGEGEPSVRPLTPSEMVAIGSEGELSEEIFERCLDDLLYRTWQEKEGVLFVLRNEVPTVMLPPGAVRETAAALYHDDLRIAHYCHGIAARREKLEEAIDRTCVLLPWNAGSIMRHLDARRAYPSQAESAGGQVKRRADGGEIWQQSLDDLCRLGAKKPNRPSVRVYDGRLEGKAKDDDHKEVLRHARALTRESFVSAPSLPDCWVWLHRRHVTTTQQGRIDVSRGIKGLISFARDVGGSDEATLDAIQKGELRILNVSRARYNPRFRGRLLLDGKAARRRLLHAAICLAISKPIIDDDGKRILS